MPKVQNPKHNHESTPAPSSFVFSYPAKITAGKPARQTAGKLRVFVIGGCLKLSRFRIPKNQIKTIHHESTKIGKHEKGPGVLYNPIFFRVFVIRGCLKLSRFRIPKNQIKTIHHESTKIGKHEKGPIFLRNPSSFVFFNPAKITAGKLRVFVIMLWLLVLFSNFCILYSVYCLLSSLFYH